MAFQEADTPGIMFPITKYTIQIRSVKEIPIWIKNAFYLASTGRPGPVVVDIPRDVQLEKVEKVEWPERPYVPGYREFRTNLDREKLRRAAEIMAEAERPVILAGTGVVVVKCHGRSAQASRNANSAHSFHIAWQIRYTTRSSTLL